MSFCDIFRYLGSYFHIFCLCLLTKLRAVMYLFSTARTISLSDRSSISFIQTFVMPCLPQRPSYLKFHYSSSQSIRQNLPLTNHIDYISDMFSFVNFWLNIFYITYCSIIYQKSCKMTLFRSHSCKLLLKPSSETCSNLPILLN